MSKEYLEAFERIKNFLGFNYCNADLPNEIKCVEQALQRLETIDNANPSEVMECLENIGHWELANSCMGQVNESEEYNTIKQALITAQKQEDKVKAFDLINEKRVDIKMLHWAYPSVEAYNVTVREQKDYWWREELTPEEFELLKRYLYET